jgi:hypothetical protein
MGNKLEELTFNHKQAKIALDNELLRIWPKDSEVEFKIYRKQVNFSTGTVCGSSWDAGCLQVKHHQAKPNSRHSYRDVHYTKIKQP